MRTTSAFRCAQSEGGEGTAGSVCQRYAELTVYVPTLAAFACAAPGVNSWSRISPRH